jgi:hypothetical protein
MANAGSVTFPGRSLLVSRLKGNMSEPLNIGWGTGTFTGSTNANVNLFTPATEARTAGTSSGITTSYLADTYQVTGSITATAAKTITEVGLFDTSTLSPTTTLAATATAGATSITLGAAGTLPGANNYYVQMNGETMLVTAGQGTTLVTVTRGQFNNAAVSGASGASVTLGGDGGARVSWTLGGQTASVPAASGGDCFAHADFGGLSLNSGDSILFTITDQFSGA